MPSSAIPDSLSAALASRYTLERELGRGGMATVYLATDLRHGRHVALKVLRPELASALGNDRFLREIRLAARLQHPHICSVHDSGEADGHLWFTMPYLEGETLRQRLGREERIPLDEAVRIVLEVADALDYAHRHGVIHRDIKPENILLTERHAVVADFGIGRAVATSQDERLTDTGMVIGTPGYMSPEQAAGETSLDGRTDVYALGAVMYEMLAGEPAFSGRSLQAVIASHLRGEIPSLHRTRPDVPDAIERAVSRALAPAPADRFPTSGEFARSLAAAPATSGTVVGAVESQPGRAGQRRRRMLIGSAATAAIVAVAAAALLFWGRRSSVAVVGTVPKRLAVLPFDNLGDSADDYFASGMADAVRGKLAGLGGLEVIARSSVEQLPVPIKVEMVARSLGVDYVLTGTVRWAKSPGGGGRVEVSPELLVVTGRGPPLVRWQEPFDSPMGDVFQVQSAIAERVAHALDIALSGQQRQAVAAAPTASLPAYDAFLRGEHIGDGLGTGQPLAIRRALAAYQDAVALDSNFAIAWTQLSRAASLGYHYAEASLAMKRAALHAAERALALAPGRAEGFTAMGDYFGLVLADNGRALDQYRRAAQLAPPTAELLASTAQAEGGLGHWADALRHLRQARALDPRSIGTLWHLGELLVRLRLFPEALALADTGLTVAPTNLALIEVRTLAKIGQGDLAGAQRTLDDVSPEIERPALLAYVGAYWDLAWVLNDRDERALLDIGADRFDNSPGSQKQVFAEASYARGDIVQARRYGREALPFDEVGDGGNDPQGLALRGLNLAYCGRFDEAIRSGERAAALLPISADAELGAYIEHQLIRIYLLAGEREKALQHLEALLRVPYMLSPGRLRIDPDFNPLRGDPRFERLTRDPPPGTPFPPINPP